MTNIHLFSLEIALQVSLNHHLNMQMYKEHMPTCLPNQLIIDADLQALAL